MFEIQLSVRLVKFAARETSIRGFSCRSFVAMGLLWATFSSSVAGATDLVVHNNLNPTLPMQEVVEYSGRSFEQLYPISMTDLVAQRTPILQGTGQLYLCYSAPTALLATESVLEQVREALSYGEFERSTELLRTTVATLGCLVEPLDPTIGAKVYLYRGYLELVSDREDLAKASFRQAKLYDPELEWDFFLPPDGKPVFDASGVNIAEEELSAVQVLPPPSVGALYVNGHSVDTAGIPIELPAGIHVIQVAIPQLISMTLQLQPGDQATLVIPSAVPPDGVNWAENEHLRPALSAVFRASVQPDISVFVVGDKSLWEFDVSEGEWTNTIVAADEQRAAASIAAARAKLPKTVAWYGAAGTATLTTIAAALLGASGTAGKKARDAEEAYDSALLNGDHMAAIESYNDSAKYRRKASGMGSVGGISLLLAGGGGLFTAVNFELGHSRRKVLPPHNPYSLDVAPAAEDSGTAPVKSED